MALASRPIDIVTGLTPESVAIVHDYLNQCGGAERVVIELARMWPTAPIYTSLYRPRSTFAEFSGSDVRTTWLDRLPLDRAFRVLAPLYPLGFRSFGTLDQQLVISSSSGWAHGVRTAPESLHVVYCHTPPRWLHRRQEHLGRSFGPVMLGPLNGPLRRWDRRAALRADVYVANCENVRRRIQDVYGRDAEIVHPPVDVDRFSPRPRGQRLLVISRLLPYKRVDLIVRAATKAGIGLDVVGVGPSLKALHAAAGSGVVFHGRVDDVALQQLIEGCRALCVAATEDFGIAPLEALAAGKPVVAYAAGGVLETLRDGVTAAFFRERTVDAVLDAVRRADALSAEPADLAAAARRFSPEVFQERLASVLARSLAARGEATQ